MKNEPITHEVIQRHLVSLPGWQLNPDGKSIQTGYSLKNFVSAVHLINQIAELSEALNHHPDIHLTDYRKLNIVLSTHSAGGLTDLDFTLARQIEDLPKDLKGPS